MKKLTKLSLLIFIPFGIGLICVLCGIFTGNKFLTDMGFIILSIGVPVCIFVLVVVGLILMITGRLGGSSYKSETPNSTDSEASFGRNEEIDELNTINSSYGYESRIRSGEYHARHVANNYRFAKDREKIFCWLFFGFLMTDFALIVVFAILNIFIGSIVCFAIFGGTILISLIVKIILEQLSLRGGKPNADSSNVLNGVVLFCVFSSSTSTGGRRRYHTTRITGVKYRLAIEADGKQYFAYTREYFEEGEAVSFVIVKGKLVSVINNCKN